MNNRPASPHRYPHQNELACSRSEKVVGHKAFDAALERELQEVIREAKQKAGQIKQQADLWELEFYLTQCRKEIGRKYDYGYWQLDLAFGRLLREKWVAEGDLRGEEQAASNPSLHQLLYWNGPSMTWF